MDLVEQHQLDGTLSTVADAEEVPEPVVTHSPTDAQPGEKIDHGEVILTPDEARQKLHAQHHPYKVLEIRKVPGSITPPA